MGHILGRRLEECADIVLSGALELHIKVCNPRVMSRPPVLADVLGRLRAFRRAEGLSYSALALRVGLSRAALRGMDSAAWAPSAETIRAIEAIVPPDWQPIEAPVEAGAPETIATAGEAA